MDVYDSIGERIRELRKRKGLSQENVAEALDISVKHLSKIERDEVSFSVPILIKISMYFEVSSDYILKGEEYKLSKTNLLYLINNLKLEL